MGRQIFYKSRQTDYVLL